MSKFGTLVMGPAGAGKVCASPTTLGCDYLDYSLIVCTVHFLRRLDSAPAT